MIYLIILLGNIERKNVKIFINEHKDVYQIHNLGVSIEHLYEYYIETHIDDDMIEKLTNLGYKIQETQEMKYYFTGYHDYVQMVAKLDSIESEYPNLAKKVFVGTTQQGRTIWALKISDNVNLIEPEPRVRFIGIIHGDEPIGCELTLYLADTLTKSYNIDPYITNLVNTREIYLIPMFNVDGRENSSRYYANWVDPNRNFPVPDSSIGDDGTDTVYQETQALMDWSDTMNFVLSVTYHGGAKIVNYQWDYTYVLPPLYELIRKIAIGYAIRNDTIFLSPSVAGADSGTIRGYVWYEVDGSLQDWSYHWTGCIDLTVELDNIKWPSSSKLPVIWNCNRNSMLWIIEQSGKGISGLVKDSITGNPLKAVYQIQGVDKTFKTGNNGEFSRPLLSGNYTLTFSKDNYFSKTLHNIPVSFDTTTYIEVKLSPITGIIVDTTNINLIIKNPFKKDDTFVYFIPESGYYNLEIFDISGRIKRTIFKNKFLSRGLSLPQRIEGLNSGIYFIRLSYEKNNILKKIIYLK